MAEEYDRWYLERERALEKRLEELEQRNQELQASIRRRLDLTPEEREDAYMAGYQPLAQELAELASTHIQEVERERAELDRKLHAGAGPQFAAHLVSLAGMPHEKLPELMATARRTEQTDLEQAVAETALERNHFGIFQEWARAHPEKGEALRRFHSLPDPERLAARTKARTTLFKASLVSLTPPPQEVERVRRAQAAREKAAREQAAAAEASRAAFFNRPTATRRVGRRVS